MSLLVVPVLIVCLVVVIAMSIWIQRMFLREMRELRERVAELEVRQRHSDEDRGHLQERLRDAERMMLRRDMDFIRYTRDRLDEAVRDAERPSSVKADTPPDKPPPSLYERIGKDEDDP